MKLTKAVLVNLDVRLRCECMAEDQSDAVYSMGASWAKNTLGEPVMMKPARQGPDDIAKIIREFALLHRHEDEPAQQVVLPQQGMELD